MSLPGTKNSHRSKWHHAAGACLGAVVLGHLALADALASESAYKPQAGGPGANPPAEWAKPISEEERKRGGYRLSQEERSKLREEIRNTSNQDYGHYRARSEP